MIAETLEYLFPDIDFERECLLEDDGKGPRIVKWLRAEKQPTLQEIEAAWPVVRVALLQEKETQRIADEQQQGGIVEAKRAYTRLQTIIDGVDTATIVQLRAAIKTLARDVQHLIRATIK